MQRIIWNSLSPQAQAEALWRSPLTANAGLSQMVSVIIERVAQQGDAALRAMATEFDGVNLEQIQLAKADIDAACERVAPSLKRAIIAAADNIRAFHQAQRPVPVSLETCPGVLCEQKTEAIDSVGLYIPGGSAPLISTALMLAIPAAIAGCRRTVLITPPRVDDAILFAAKLCEVDEIYLSGGAQAIAALALGTDTIKPVDKIFGPGNAWVTEAKRQLSQDSRARITIDMPAGPSEVLVIADSGANPEFVAADLLSQAEHGPDSQVMLVTDCEELASSTEAALERQIAALPRAEIARQALSCSRTILVDDLSQAAEVSNQYAPEHLIVQTQNPRTLLPQLRSAGSIFLGPWTPESVGDYASGTNHVLPTYGYAASLSSLSLADFSRCFTVQELSRDGLMQIGQTVMTLAAAEQLDAHKNAVAIRLEAKQ
ncbi:MAG: histidinol dehydrogenase [Shewanella sp.]|nr:histidinol dehydrogenase [Shewanella sp.]MCF1430811.1 histidinol dehydrogenase [Shewanella sp.]MCF1458047.1 histidinol dehydrogenase [Shewanella sp.]